MQPLVQASSKLSRAQANRVAWALKEYGESVAAALLRDMSACAEPFKSLERLSAAEAVTRLLMEQADPTSNKRFTPWLAREYAAGRLVLEDLGSANETLSLFQRYAPLLKPALRDIQCYANLAEAWDMVSGPATIVEGRLSRHAQRSLDRAKAYAESKILHQTSDGFMVAVPLTEFSAQWWGRGTKWCTSGSSANQFFQYHKDGPLFVFVVPKYGKFQMQVTATNFYLKNAEDFEVGREKIAEIWQWLGPILLTTVQKHGLGLEKIPEKHLNYAICLNAVTKNGDALSAVPLSLRSYELCLQAARSPQICFGSILPAIPPQYYTDELLHAAVKSNGRSLEFIPEHARTDGLIEEAIEQKGGALYFVPLEKRTRDFCRRAVQKNGRTLQLVPNEHRDAEICRIAVSENSDALEWVPEELKLSLGYPTGPCRTNGILPFVPKKQRRYEDWMQEVTRSGAALADVPDKLITEEMCLVAVERDGFALHHVPEHLLSREMCLRAVQQTPDVILRVPAKLRDIEIWAAALKKDANVITKLPEHLKHEVLYSISRGSLQGIPLPWPVELLDEWQAALCANHEPEIMLHGGI